MAPEDGEGGALDSLTHRGGGVRRGSSGKTQAAGASGLTKGPPGGLARTPLCHGEQGPWESSSGSLQTQFLLEQGLGMAPHAAHVLVSSRGRARKPEASHSPQAPGDSDGVLSALPVCLLLLGPSPREGHKS